MDARPIPIYVGEVLGGVFGAGETKWEYEVDEEGHKTEEPRHLTLLREDQVFEGNRALAGSYFVMVNLGVVVANYIPETIENGQTLQAPTISILPNSNDPGEDGGDLIELKSDGKYDLTLIGSAGSYGNEISPQLVISYGGPAVRLTFAYRTRVALWSVPDRTDVNT